MAARSSSFCIKHRPSACLFALSVRRNPSIDVITPKFSQEVAMRFTKMRFGVVTASLLVASAAIIGLGSYGWDGFGEAVAATAAQRAEFQQVLAALRATDTAYVSGNAAEAQAQFEKAKSNWDMVSPAISKREAREAQLLFDSLGALLKSGAPAAKVKSTIDGMVSELRRDPGNELR
jgi:hypothetical protein